MLFFLMLASASVTVHHGVREDSEDVIAELYLAYESKVYNYAYWILRDEHDASCALTDTFIRALRYRTDVEGSDAIGRRVRLFGYARAACLDIIRKRKRVLPAESISNVDRDDNGEFFDAEIPDDTDILQILLTKEVTDQLVQALRSLEPVDQQIVIYKVYYDMRNTEIAEELEMNVSTVSTRLSRVFKKMKKELEVYFREADQ